MEQKSNSVDEFVLKSDSPAELEVVPIGSDDSIEDFKARERKVVRKLDLYIAPLMGSFNFIVRLHWPSGH